MADPVEFSRKKSALQHATNRGCKQESAYNSAEYILCSAVTFLLLQLHLEAVTGTDAITGTGFSQVQHLLFGAAMHTDVFVSDVQRFQIHS